MSAPLLQVDGLTVAFGGVRAVDGVSFALADGARFALLGESGSGKTLTARAIAGLLPGEATVSGAISWPALGRPPVAGRDIGFVFQDPMSSLNPVLRIGEQIGEVVVTHLGLSWAEARTRSLELLRAVGIPEPERRIDGYPHEFSGGQRQRIAIAIAIAAEPRLLIADEPTTALDTVIQSEIVALIRRIADDRRMAVILITHDIALAATLARDVAILRDGRLVEIGRAADVLRSPRAPYTRDLLAANLDFDHVQAGRSAVDGAALLSISGIGKRYSGPRGVAALAGVDLALKAGETLALVGASGAGKSTLARIVMRLLAADTGQVAFEGQDLLALQGAALRRVRRGIQMVFQDPLSALNPRATVGRLLADPLRVHDIVPAARRPAAVAAMLRRVGLPAEFAARYPHELSGGQRQRVNIARALATSPRLLVLDEPVSSLDVSIRAQILDLLQDIQRQDGIAYLFVTHDLAVARAVADRIAVMADGRVVEQGPVEDVLAAPRADATRRLVAAAPRLQLDAA